MKRLLIVSLLTSAFGVSCADEEPPQGGMDATIALPDAMVVVPPRDAGVEPPEYPVPTITNVSPSSGTERGGTRVTIRGTSFIEPVFVSFGGLEATNVVVLDEVSIAATTPEHAPGSVTVNVSTRGGAAELPNGFRYHRELVITSLSESRLPEEGGVYITVKGRGFDENTIILFDRKPLARPELVDAETIEGYVPALEPGRPEVRAMHREAETRRSDVAVVYATPEIAAVAPGYGSIDGGEEQTLAGDGFEGAQMVHLGGVPAPGLSVSSGESLSVRSPVLSAGVHPVWIANSDAVYTLDNGYIAYDPNDADFELLGVTPARVSSAGGMALTLVGHGIPGDARVFIGGVEAMVTEIRRPNVVLVVVPAGLAVDQHDVQITSASLGANTELTDVLTVYGPMTITSIDPVSGSSEGGTNVTIRGTGFLDITDLRIGDVQLGNVVFVSETEITATTHAGAHGAQDVWVKSRDTRAVLEDAFRFEEPFALIRVDPAEGSIAGNTYVTVFGRGIDAPAAVKFGTADGLEPVLENGSVLGVRTAPASPGVVDVAVTTARGDATFEDAFVFYDPRLITGGAWGGPIEGSVNVAVLDINSGDPKPGIVVQLGYDADLRYAAITDENGLATISSPEIRGAQTITTGQNGVEFVTFMELNARNLTVFAEQYVSPTSPCPDPPMGAVPPIVKGRLFKFKSSLDPITNPGWTAVARITYTQSSVFGGNPPDPQGLVPSQVDFVYADGEEYEISVLRLGTVAIYAILYDYHQETQQLIPRKMGIARQVPAAIGTVTEPINISMDIDLTEQLVITMADPPQQFPGPSINAVFPFLNLESDGVIPFQATAAPGGTVILNSMPDVSASSFFYMGGSFTDGGNGALQSPYSLTLVESGAPLSEGLELGPFVGMPQDVEPKLFGVVEQGGVSWEQGGPTPDITRINVIDFPSGCCCIDLSANDACEEGEPQMCGPSPVPVNRWSIFAEGGLETYVMPRMISGLNAFDTPSWYEWQLQEAIAPRFDYDEFIYNQFSPYFWTSWNVWGSAFVTREETE
jgi:hypothetical protein